MTASEFTKALATIGWSQRHLATLLGCDTNLPTRWARGAPIPEPIADWLEVLVYAHRHHKPPGNWRVRSVIAAHERIEADGDLAEVSEHHDGDGGHLGSDLGDDGWHAR